VWSPDGKSIAFVGDRSENPDLNYGTDIWSVSVDGNDHPLVQVTSHPGRDFSPTWSPDGKSIAYVSSTGLDIGGSALTPTRRLAITEVGKDERRILTPDLDRNISDPEFSANGRHILFRLEDSGQVHFASVRTNGSNLERHLERQVTVRDYASGDGHTVLLVAQADQPTELYTFDGGNLAPLTHVNGDLLDGVARAEVEKLRFESADGTPVEAFYVKPVGHHSSQRYPTILWLHGGPASQFSYSFSEVAQLFAANGYAVIMPNPRGSTGYGEEFAQGTVAA